MSPKLENWGKSASRAFNAALHRRSDLHDHRDAIENGLDDKVRENTDIRGTDRASW